MLVDLDHAQTLIIKFVDDCLDTRGFTGAAVTEQEHIVRLSALDKRLRVVHQLFLLDLVADQIIQNDLIHIIDRLKLHPRAVLRTKDAESLVQTKHAHPVILVETGDPVKKTVGVLRPGKRATERLHLFTHIFIVHQLRLADRLII